MWLSLGQNKNKCTVVITNSSLTSADSWSDKLIELSVTTNKEFYIFLGYEEFLDYHLQTLLYYKYIVYLPIPKETGSDLMTLSAGFAFLLLLCLILRHKQFIIFTVHLKQFFMRTTFQNLTICNIHNAVRIFNCRQTMCNNKRGTSL